MSKQGVEAANYGWEPAALREANTRLILNLLRDRGNAISRQDLADASGLSPVTVGKIIRRLQSIGFVEETDTDRGGGGRPVGLVEIISDGGYVVGALPRADSIDGVVMDLRGTVIASAHSDIDMYGRSDDFAERLGAFVAKLIDQSGVAKSAVLGVGLGMPGHIDAQNGVCLEAWALGLKNYEITGPLEQILQLPILIDNDANCVGAYEVLFGQATDRKRSIVVSLGKGLGMAIVIDGVIYQGASGMAGDIGHSPVLGADRLCECGRVGCLETFCSDRGVVRNFEVATGRTTTLDEIIAGAESGDSEALAALTEGGKLLGTALSAAISTLDPASVVLVLGDGLSGTGAAFLDPMREVLDARLESSSESPEVFVEHVGYERWAQGAGSLALNQFFTPGAPGFSRSDIAV